MEDFIEDFHEMAEMPFVEAKNWVDNETTTEP